MARTKHKKIAVLFKIIFICSVSLVYFILKLLSNNYYQYSQNFEELPNSSRKLLALEAAEATNTNNNSSAATTQIFENICTPAAINEFPSDGFTREERQKGWVVLHILIVSYLFLFLAVICDDYFVPCIRHLCDSFQFKEDIAGATLMAVASSSAEIFINSIGTFITEGDIGVGTIVGSAVFNVLAVPACCGFFANTVLDLEWYPLTRDSIVYAVAVILLIIFLQDGKIYYYEALILISLYIIYIFVMVFNEQIKNFAHKIVSIVQKKNRHFFNEIITITTETQPLLMNSTTEKVINYTNGGFNREIFNSDVTLKDLQDLSNEETLNIWKFPKREESRKKKCWWIFTWPLSFLLFFTTPSTKNHPKLYLITFTMCVFWIGGVAYLIAWLITIIGDSLEIPDSVMGLTFLAAGTSVPEAVSSVLVTNQGHGSMGISSSIGSNTFDILLCLGLPWFIKSAFYPKIKDQHWITINSQGINYSATCLLATLILLYLSFYLNKFKLDWKVGLACLSMYGGFLLFATLLELNVFFLVNLPICGQ